MKTENKNSDLEHFVDEVEKVLNSTTKAERMEMEEDIARYLKLLKYPRYVVRTWLALKKSYCNIAIFVYTPPEFNVYLLDFAGILTVITTAILLVSSNLPRPAGLQLMLFYINALFILLIIKPYKSLRSTEQK